MRVLYRDYNDETLAVAEVTGTTYFEEEEVLQFIGTDRDFGIHADKATAEKLVRSLYLEDRLDVTGYESCDVDVFFEEDDDFDEDFEGFDEDDENILNVFFPDDEEEPIRIPRTIRFPKRP